MPFSASQFLDHVRASGRDPMRKAPGIDSDYRVAQLTGMTKAAMSRYRKDLSIPDDETIVRLCLLTGEDPARYLVDAAAARSRDEATRALWERIAERLSAATLSVLFAIGFGALAPDDAQAAHVVHRCTSTIEAVHIVSSSLRRLARWVRRMIAVAAWSLAAPGQPART